MSPYGKAFTRKHKSVDQLHDRRPKTDWVKKDFFESFFNDMLEGELIEPIAKRLTSLRNATDVRDLSMSSQWRKNSAFESNGESNAGEVCLLR